MSTLVGKVGKLELKWKSAPHGRSGTAEVELGGKLMAVSWVRDRDGLWLELPDGVHGFDLRRQKDDDGRVSYDVLARGSDAQWSALSFVRPGQETEAGQGGPRKSGVRVRAQMPGKIVRILTKAGEAVEKDQPLIVMEAMKMENEIRAPQAGRIKEVKVSEGQAVETGADLLLIDST